MVSPPLTFIDSLDAHTDTHQETRTQRVFFFIHFSSFFHPSSGFSVAWQKLELTTSRGGLGWVDGGKSQPSLIHFSLSLSLPLSVWPSLCLFHVFSFQWVQTNYGSSSASFWKPMTTGPTKWHSFFIPCLSPPLLTHLPTPTFQPASQPPTHPVCFPNIPVLVCDCDGLSSRRNVLLSHLVPLIWREAFAPGFRLCARTCSCTLTHTHFWNACF